MSEKCNRGLGDFYFSVLLKWQTWDINVAAFLAGRGVVASFTEETWPDYQDAAIVVEGPGRNREYGYMRWNMDFEGIDLLDMRYA